MIHTDSIKHHTYVSTFCKKLLPVFLLSAVIALSLPGAGGSAMAQDAQVQDSGGTMHVQGDQGTSNPATPASQQQGQVSGQAQQPHETGDLQGVQGGEITYFDSSTIPESVPIPDADWVFEVPIDVSDLPAEVTQLGIVCQTFDFEHGRKIRGGDAKKRLDLQRGSYHDTVMIGVNKNYPSGHNVREPNEYECYMYLIGPDNRWVIPDSDPVSPVWRRADPSRPFRWKTGRQSIPEEARIGRE